MLERFQLDRESPYWTRVKQYFIDCKFIGPRSSSFPPLLPFCPSSFACLQPLVPSHLRQFSVEWFRDYVLWCQSGTKFAYFFVVLWATSRLGNEPAFLWRGKRYCILKPANRFMVVLAFPFSLTYTSMNWARMKHHRLLMDVYNLRWRTMYLEIYAELEKVRNMLLIQHTINQQHLNEVSLPLLNWTRVISIIERRNLLLSTCG